MPKRSKTELWDALVKEAREDEDEFQRAASASVEEAERGLAASGLDVEAEREKAGEWRREIEQRVAARKRKELEEASRTRSSPPERSSPPAVLWLVAATVGAAIGGGLVYGAMHHAVPPVAPPAPSPAPSTPRSPPPPPDPVAARDLRHQARWECDDQFFDTCLADLDRARALDPAGDETPEVEAMRAQAIHQILVGPKPK
jgi:hypothetical protein